MLSRMEPTRKPLVVGYDGSADARRALTWAVVQGERLRRPLLVVIARGDLYKLSTWADEWTRGLAEEWAAGARQVLEAAAAGDASVEVVDGMAVPTLLERSGSAWLVAVGTRGHGPVMGALVGSTSQHLTRYATCSVVVVRPTHDERSTQVCVGVDGSTESLRALDFALELAAASELSVRAIHSRADRWHLVHESSDDRGHRILGDAMRDDEAQVDAAVASAGERWPGVALTLERSHDRPVRALVDASGHAHLVVVGSRGRGGFEGLLLGSVSSGVVTHARCPVAVAR
jgi:nucleotide-binding universal stress UspA family protein